VVGAQGELGKTTKLVRVLWEDCNDVRVLDRSNKVALVSNDRCGKTGPKSSQAGRLLCHSDHGVFVTAKQKLE